jgi:GTP cyclohydrolase II
MAASRFTDAKAAARSMKLSLSCAENSMEKPRRSFACIHNASREQLELSLRKIAQAGSGILLYLPQEGRGIGLMNKLRAYELQDGGMDTVEANETLGFAADARDYDFSAQILKKLGATKIRLLSNNPEKVRQLEDSGIRVVQRVPCQPRISKISRAYLQTKKSKMGHLLDGL